MGNQELRRARETAGLTQGELAARAGVSRQLVSGAEQGRHAPSVDTALRLAAALGRSVESLFGGAEPEVAIPPGGLPEGTPVVVGRVGDGLVAHPLGDLVAGDAAWAVPDGVVEGGTVRLMPGAGEDALIVVGCDPVLGLCATLLAHGGSRRLAAVAGTTAAAVEALGAARAHAGIVHGPPDGLPVPPEGVVRVHLARWRVGVAGSGGSLEEVLAGGVPLVQRDEGAASQQALVRAAGGLVPPAAWRARGHVEAARRAALTGCAAVTFEPAALTMGLPFIPLEEHVVELWIAGRRADHPGALALVDLLGSDGFRRRAGLVGGYDLEGAGSLVRAA